MSGSTRISSPLFGSTPPDAWTRRNGNVMFWHGNGKLVEYPRPEL